MHEQGCGGTREDARNLCGLIAGYIHHPNVAGATVLSLGCQHSQVDDPPRRNRQARSALREAGLLVLNSSAPARNLRCSPPPCAIRSSRLLDAEKAAPRRPSPLSQLCLGLKCGGSDGFSGISANPRSGILSDLVAALGGRANSFRVSRALRRRTGADRPQRQHGSRATASSS